MKKTFFIVSFLIFALFFAAILPYPVLSNHTNITERNAFHINNAAEIEISPTTAPCQPQIVPLNFCVINRLILQEDEFEIFDVCTQESFFAVRVGGKNHIDFQPATTQDMQIFATICGNFSWSRRPVLIKLNEIAFVPASIAAMPHGYTGFLPNQAQNSSNTAAPTVANLAAGHFCLHFLQSKTDGTQEEDFYHQRAIKKAISQGTKILQAINKN